jgi:hypothetical protein
MNVVDSSAWLEYFAGTEQAEPFVEADSLIYTIALKHKATL